MEESDELVSHLLCNVITRVITEQTLLDSLDIQYTGDRSYYAQCKQ